MSTQDYSSVDNILDKYHFPKPKAVDGPEGYRLSFAPYKLSNLSQFFSELTGKQLTDFIPAEFTKIIDSIEITSEQAIAGSEPDQGLVLLKKEGGGFEVSFAIEWDTPWNIDDTVSITDSYVAFIISRGATEEGPTSPPISIDATINSGKITFNKKSLNLQLSAKVPALIIKAELAASKPGEKDNPDHQAVAEQYLGQLKDKEKGSIRIEDIKFSAAPYLKNYSFYLDVDNVLNLHDKLTVKEFQADIQYRGGVEGGYSILAYTDIELGFEANPIEITLVAKREKAGQSGKWNFGGAIAHPVSFKTVLQDINQLFGADNTYQIPGFLNEIILEKLSLDVQFTDTPDDKDKEFTFTLDVKLPVAGRVLDLSVFASYKKSNDTYVLDLKGEISLAARKFTVEFKESKTSSTSLSVLEALYTPANDAVDITELLAKATDDPALLDELPDISIKLDELLFALIKDQGIPGKYLFGVALDLGLDLSKLPIVGKAFGPGEFGIEDLQFLYATDSLTQLEVQNINSNFSALKDPPKSTPADASGSATNPTTTVATTGSNGSPIVMTKGLSFKANINLGSTSPSTIALPTGGNSGKSEEEKSGFPKKAPSLKSAADSGTTWIDLQKTIGPVTVDRIGGRFKDKKLWFLISAAINLGALDISLEGLGIGATIKKDFDPLKDLDVTVSGVGLSFQGGPVEVTGAFLKSPSIPDYYSGYALIKALNFAIDAFGGYGKDEEGDTSVFAFVSVDIPIGGPAFFFVTGFSLGFGYNMSFKVPTIREVPTFPLIDTGLFKGPGLEENPAQALAILNKFIRPKAHSLWFAAGIQFTSFEILDSKALLVVDLGAEQITVLGQTTLVLPKEVGSLSAYINVKLGLVVFYNIREGIFSARARIADGSYLLDPACHVFGEFACIAWFKGEHKGNFVLSLGGYHPRFNKPAFYPNVERVGFFWQVVSGLVIKGSLYFALTPSAVMAGFNLSVTYQAGPLRAWLIALADLLLQWKPFKYDIKILISIGAKFSIFKLEMGAGLRVYGPPMGGSVHVGWYIISFTIHFGKKADKKPPRLTWKQFETNFLPASNPENKRSEICRVKIANGLVKKDKEDWIVRADEVLFNTETIIPSKSFSLSNSSGQTKEITFDGTKPIGIRPMALKDLYHSSHDIKIVYKGEKDPNNDPEKLDHWITETNVSGLPAALWATTPVKPRTPEAKTITTGVGLSVLTPRSFHPEEVNETSISYFNHVDIANRSYLTEQTNTITFKAVEIDPGKVLTSIASELNSTQAARLQLIEEVNQLFDLVGTDQAIGEDLRGYSDQLEQTFQSLPQIAGFEYQANGETITVPSELPEQALKPWEAPQYPSIKLYKSYRLFGHLNLVDNTLNQLGLLDAKSPMSLNIYPGSIFLVNRSIPEKVTTQLNYQSSSQQLFILGFNDVLNVADHLLADATHPLNNQNLSQQSTQLAIYGIPSQEGPVNICGWTQNFNMPFINSIAFLGKELILRPQAPYQIQGQESVIVEEIFDHNQYQGDDGKYYQGWTDTLLFCNNGKEVIVELNRKDNDFDLGSNLVVSIPYQEQQGVRNYLPPSPLIPKEEPKQVGAYWRVRYGIPEEWQGKTGFAIRISIIEQAQASNQVQGIYILCGNTISDQEWLAADLEEQICAASPASEQAPILRIGYQIPK